MKTINISMVLALAFGVAVFPANADLTLPYAGSVSTGYNTNAFSITNTGYGDAIYAEASSDVCRAISAKATGATSTGVQGVSTGTTGSCRGGAFFAYNSPYGVGVHGSAWANGVDVENYGGSFSALGGKGKGVVGYGNNEGDVKNYGGYFWALGKKGVGIYAKGGPNGYAGEFDGLVKIGSIEGTLIIKSRTTGQTIIELGEGLDYAEGFDVSNKSEITAGSVLVIDANNPGKLRLSNTAYDKKVAGIVAGAKGQGSAVRVGIDKFDFDVSLAGRVYCNVDATEAAVEPGDLLTTSSTPGYAMKAVEYMRAQGATLGKAMERLEKGKKGQILVLVTLQ
jgi:hypothetical protein